MVSGERDSDLRSGRCGKIEVKQGIGLSIYLFLNLPSFVGIKNECESHGSGPSGKGATILEADLKKVKVMGL